MSIFNKNQLIEITPDDINDAAQSTKGLDETIKKRAFANVIAARLGIKFLSELECKSGNLNSLYKIHSVLKDIDIADITCENIRLDVRLISDENKIFIPKSHFDYEIQPDIYIIMKLESDFSAAEFLGAIAPDEIDKTAQNRDFYFVDNSILYNAKSLKNIIKDGKPASNIPPNENDFIKAQSMLVNFSDGDILNTDKHFLYKQLVNNKELREMFSEFENFETLSTEVSHNEAIMGDSILNVVGAQELYSDEDADFGLNVNLDELADSTVADFVEGFTGDNDNEEVNMEEEDNIIDLAEIEDENEDIFLEEIAPNENELFKIPEEFKLEDESEIQEEFNDTESHEEGAFEGFEGLDVPMKEEILEPDEIIQPDGEIIEPENIIQDSEQFEEIDLDDLDTDLELPQLEDFNNDIELPAQESIFTDVNDDIIPSIEPEPLVELQDSTLTDSPQENKLDIDETINEVSGFDLSEFEGFEEHSDELEPIESDEIADYEVPEELLLEPVSDDEPVSDKISSENGEFEELPENFEEVNLPENFDFNVINEHPEQTATPDIEPDIEQLQDISLNSDNLSDINIDELDEDDDEDNFLNDNDLLNDEISNLIDKNSDFDLSDINLDELNIDDENIEFNNLNSTEFNDDDDIPVYHPETDANYNDELPIINNTQPEFNQQEYNVSEGSEDYIPEYNNESDIETLYEDKSPNRIPGDAINKSLNQNIPQYKQQKNKKKKNFTPILLTGLFVILLAFGFNKRNELMAKFNIGQQNSPLINQDMNMPIEGENSLSDLKDEAEDEELLKEPIDDGQTTDESKHTIGDIPDEDNQSTLNKNIPNMQPTTSSQKHLDMNESITNVFSKTPEPLNSNSIKKLSWEVSEDMAYNDAIIKYLQIAGKTLKLSLQNDMLVTTDMPYSTQMVIDLQMSKDGELRNTNVAISSGSEQIDKIVLQSVKATLKYVKPPSAEIKGDTMNFSLIINF